MSTWCHVCCHCLLSTTKLPRWNLRPHTWHQYMNKARSWRVETSYKFCTSTNLCSKVSQIIQWYIDWKIPRKMTGGKGQYWWERGREGRGEDEVGDIKAEVRDATKDSLGWRRGHFVCHKSSTTSPGMTITGNSQLIRNRHPPRQCNGTTPLTDDVISFDSRVPLYIMILAFCHWHPALCGKVHGHHKHMANKINSTAAHNHTL